MHSQTMISVGFYTSGARVTSYLFALPECTLDDLKIGNIAEEILDCLIGISGIWLYGNLFGLQGSVARMGCKRSAMNVVGLKQHA